MEPILFSHIMHQDDVTVLDTRWIPGTVKFAAAGAKDDGTGCLKILQLNENDITCIQAIANAAPFKCCAFGVSPTNNAHLAIADFDGMLQILNVECPDKYVYKVPNAHKSIINGIDTVANGDSAAIVSGGRDGFIKVWDPRQQNKPAVIILPKNATSACWAVAFANATDTAGRCVIGAYENGNLNVYDLRTLKMVADARTEHRVCSVECHRKYAKIGAVVCGTRQGSLQLYRFDDNLNHVCCARQVHQEACAGSRTIWCVRHLPQNSDIFGTCDGTGSVRLWGCQAASFTQLAELKVDKAAVNSFDWHPNRVGLAVCSTFSKKINIICTANLEER